MKPFIKWVGGKRSILQRLVEEMPSSYTHYYEPFLGGGALFFKINPERAYLSDVNPHLITTYKAVRDSPVDLGVLLQAHESKHNKDYYYSCRDRLNTEEMGIETAALFIYLNRTCFNGLWRVNKNGHFNVPVGSYKSPTIHDPQTLTAASQILQKTSIKQQSFEKITVHKGAFYYLDPPYHKTFTSYSSNSFGEKQQEELAKFCKKIDRGGGFFMLSNSNTPLIQKLYKEFNTNTVQARRSVSCQSESRGKEKEVLVKNYSNRAEEKIQCSIN